MTWLLGCAACFAPSPQPGAPCPSGVCPSGLVCSPATQTCERSATTVDDAATPGGSDAQSTVEPDGAMADALTCYGAGLVAICPAAPVSGTLAITANTTLDTDSDARCIVHVGANPDAYCVIAATSISIASNRRLRATGTKPLVLLSTGMLTVDGVLDVSTGAGANPSLCNPPAAAIGTQGGAGGSFAGRGGTGGDAAMGLGPVAGAVSDGIAFRGGCSGGIGAGTSPGAGGNGGGAVYLIAASITINGGINASGGGGGGGGVRAGGGGGGSGGFIGLDAASITAGGAARIFANGGGGGEGATQLLNGQAGASPAAPATPAAGGGGAVPHGGNGGGGSAGTALDGRNGLAGGDCVRGSQSGGGGGGGAGVIYVYPAQQLAGAVSPPPV